MLYHLNVRFGPLLQVKIRRNYPLTSVERIDYPVGEDRLTFRLIFSTYMMTLRAESQSEAEDWVEKIKGGEERRREGEGRKDWGREKGGERDREGGKDSWREGRKQRERGRKREREEGREGGREERE